MRAARGSDAGSDKRARASARESERESERESMAVTVRSGCFGEREREPIHSVPHGGIFREPLSSGLALAPAR